MCFALIFIGVTLASTCLIIEATSSVTPLQAAEQQKSAGLAAYSKYVTLVAMLFVVSGVITLINRLIINPKGNISVFEKLSEKLLASNYILHQTLHSRNQLLETNSSQLRSLHSKHHISRMALLKSERKFRTLFDESPAIFAAVDKQLILRDINAFGARSLGYEAVTLLGKSFSKIAAEEHRLDIEIFIARFFSETKPQQHTEARLVGEDGREIWVKISGSLIAQDNSSKHLLLVCQDISMMKALEDKLRFQARHDPLTGLWNRYAMEAKLKKLLKSTKHAQQSLAFIYFDVDQLKVVNGTCGHLAGDKLIISLTDQIQEGLPNIDCFARMGGDEFAVIKARCNSEQAHELASLIRNIAEDFIFRWKDKSYRQSVSIGVAVSSPQICTATAIIGTAEAACYAAKEEGRNRVVLLENDMETSRGNRGEMQWVSRLQEAIDKDRFELYFQPIVPLEDTKQNYVHYEILIRYINDQGEHELPDTFLSAAERYGLADQIDLWVLTTTLDFLDKHPAHTQQLDCCSINLTSHSLASHRTRSAIQQLIDSTQFPASKICFEITETSAISNLSEVSDFIKELKASGCRFALDDFGTGFSSFGYLKELDVDYIKIDGCFVRNIKVTDIDRAIVTAIKSIGQEMGIKVVAEYVENNTVINELTALNIAHGQGYGLAIPMPLNEVEAHYPLPSSQLRLLSSVN